MASAAESNSDEVSPDLIQQLFDAGIVDKEVLDRLAVKTQKDKAADDISEAAAPIIEEAAKATGMKHKDIVDRIFPYLMSQEDASGDPETVSPKGAVGVSQVMPATAAEEAGKLGMKEYDLKNPEDNKKIGSNYLDEQLEKFGGDPQLALAAYNGGPGRVAKALKLSGGTSYEDIRAMLPEETRNYVDNIGGNFHGKEGMTLADLRNGATKAAPEPGMLDKIGSAISAEFSGTAEAEEPPQAELPQRELGEDIYQVPEEADVTAAPEQSAPQVDPNENAALVNAEDTAQAGDATATLDNLAAGQTPPNTDAAMQNAFAMQQVGKTQSAEAIAQGAQNEATAYADKAKAIAQVGTDFASKRQVAETATQSDLDRFRQKVIDFGSATIQPDRIFSGPVTLGKILFGISIAAVAIGGKPGQASNLINQAIDNDLAVQKAAIDLKKQDISNEASLMSANHSQLNSIDAAETQARAQMISKAQAMVEQAAATARSEQAKANLMTLSGQLQQQQLTLEEKFKQQRLKTHSEAILGEVATTGLSKSEQKFQDMAASDPKFGEKMVMKDGKPVGFIERATDRPLFDAASNSVNDVNRNITELKELYKQYGTPILNSDSWKAMQDKVANLRQSVLMMNKGNRGFSKEVVNELNTMIPLDLFPSGTIHAAGSSISRIAFPGYVTGSLDRFQKTFNQRAIDIMDNLTRLKTPEFQDEMTELKTRYGMNSKARKLQ